MCLKFIFLYYKKQTSNRPSRLRGLVQALKNEVLSPERILV
jgi:hypothetical protein